MTASDTSSRESSASGIASASRRRRLRRATRAASAGARRPRTVTAIPPRRRRGVSLAIVRSDDLLHQRMANDVALGEGDESDAGDAAQDVLCLPQARDLA